MSIPTTSSSKQAEAALERQDNTNNADALTPPPYTTSSTKDEQGNNPLDDINISEAVPEYRTPHYRDFASSSSSSQGALVPATIKVPPAMNGYLQRKLFGAFYLGPSSSERLFSVKPHTGFRKPLIELFEGPSADTGTLLGKFERQKGDKWFGLEYMNIVIPHADGRPDTVIRFKMVTREFAVITGGPGSDGKEALPEMFHWRNTRGEEVKELAGSGMSNGWKLVRGPARQLGLASAVKSYKAGQAMAKEEKNGTTGDRREVLAVVCYNLTWTWTKAFKIALFGAGLTGTMGYDWEIATLVSALWFWVGGTDNAVKATGG